jgi:hypothetical protein
MKHPYRTARQQHLGDFLDDLQAAGLIAWVWSYSGSSAEYTITESGKEPRLYGTRDAEQLASRYAATTRRIWLPVPNPGGQAQLIETLELTAARQRDHADATESNS